MAAGFKLRAVQKSVRAAWQALPEPRSTAERIAVYQEIKAQYEVGGALTRRQDAALARMVALLPAAPQAPAVPRVAMTLAVLCIIYALLLSLNVLVVADAPMLPPVAQILLSLFILGFAASIAMTGWGVYRQPTGVAFAGLVAVSLMLLAMSLRAGLGLVEIDGGSIGAIGLLVSIGLLITIQVMARRGRGLVAADVTFLIGNARKASDGGWDFRTRAERAA